jgi:hypothetical protein
MEQDFYTPQLPLTAHARQRMSSRHIDFDDVVDVLEFGREVHARGAEFYVVGRRDVLRARQAGRNVQALEGLHVVCAPNGGPVITCYRNREMPPIRNRTRRTWAQAA